MPTVTLEPFCELTTPDYRDCQEYHELTRNARLATKQRANSYVLDDRRLSDWSSIKKSYINHKDLKLKVVNAIIIAELFKLPCTIDNKFTILPKGKWR